MSTDAHDSRFVCLDCGRSYKAVETLNRHRKNHVAGIKYTCSVCNASFKRKDLLDRHSQIHDSTKPVANTSRGLKACDRCSRLKTKCDGMTTCTRCERGGHFCSYKLKPSRAGTGRSSAGTLSSAHSPCLSIDEGKSPGSLTYSLSDPGNSVVHDQQWDADDSWTQGLWTAQDPAWHWPNLYPNLDDNAVIDILQTKPTHPRHSRSALWNDCSAGNDTESLQHLPVSYASIEDVFTGYMTTSWPQHINSVPLIDPALSEELSYSVDDGFPQVWASSTCNSRYRA